MCHIVAPDTKCQLQQYTNNVIIVAQAIQPLALQVYRAAQPDAKKQAANPAASDPSVAGMQVVNSESPIVAPSLSPPGIS